MNGCPRLRQQAAHGGNCSCGATTERPCQHEPRLWLIAQLSRLAVGRLRLIELPADPEHVALLSQCEGSRCSRTLHLIALLGERKLSESVIVSTAQPHDLATMQRALTGIRHQA